MKRVIISSAPRIVEVEKSTKGSMADIDLDVQVSRREEVKQYVVHKYGNHHVCAVGTYSRLWSRSVIKATYSAAGATYAQTDAITKAIPSKKATDRYSYSDIWKFSLSSKVFYDTLQKYPDATKSLNAIYSQIANSSIHPCATIICPRFINGVETDLRFQIPLHDVDGQLVASWEGTTLDDAGFLKMDLLGLKELDKLKDMSDLVLKSEGDYTDPMRPDFEDPKVYSLYSRGITEQVFQMGSNGLKKLAIRAQPRDVEALTAIIALYRPGPMASGAHTKWADINAGIKRPDPDPNTAHILKATGGLMIYQESVMQIASEIAGLTLVEADNLRKAMGKKKADEMAKVKNVFMEGGISNFYDEEYLESLFNNISSFSEYGFNKSHAAAYAETGYCGMWYKANYPLYFYTVALNKAEQIEIASIIYEIEEHFPDITIRFPDINKSMSTQTPDRETNSIYWSLSGIKGMGDSAVNSIIKERNLNGEFKNITDFCKRMRGTGVGGGKAEILTLAGAFDSCYDITSITQRQKIIATLYKNKFRDGEMPSDYRNQNADRPSHWSLMQRRLLGFGKIDVSGIARHIDPKLAKKIMSTDSACQLEDDRHALIGGVVSSAKEKTSRNDKLYGLIQIDDGGQGVQTYIWGDAWVKVRDDINKAKATGSAVIIEGKTGTFQGVRTLSVGDKDLIICDLPTKP